MAVTGLYIARRIHHGLKEYVTVYASLVNSDVLPIFSNLNVRASQARDDEYERLALLPAPYDFDGDMSNIAAQAEEKGIVYYTTMTALRQTTLTLHAIGLFHILEQHLAELCHDGSFSISPPSDTKLSVVQKWFKTNYGLDFASFPAWPEIEKLRLLANTAKHGEGGSEKKLRKIWPEIFEDQGMKEILPEFPYMYTSTRLRLPLAGKDLFVTEIVYKEIATSVLAFVEQIFSHLKDRPNDLYVDG